MNEDLRKQVNGILLRLYDGDTNALDALYNVMSDRLFCVAFGFVHDKGLAEEVVQDSFLKIYRYIYLFRRHDNGYAWVMKIVRNVALNTLRREKKHAVLDLDEFYSLSAPTQGDAESGEDIKKAMRALPEDEQQALWYRYYCDMTIRQVAVAMRLAKSTAADLVRKAEAHLKEKMR